MTETQKRIRAYKKALPALRERVIAVALLLAMSAAMMASASFAWLTLSRAPEVAGAATQIAANGNLEIALVYTDDTDPKNLKVLQPEESKVGDSSAAEGQTVQNANITWGNLVNLSGSTYGLDQIVLRPALLNKDALGSAPFRSVEYGEDGRVQNDMDTDFRYCTWEEPDEESEMYRFDVTGKYGVRAIAKVTEKYESELGGEVPKLALIYDAGIAEARKANIGAGTAYRTQVVNNTSAVDSLTKVVVKFVEAKIVDSNPDVSNYISDISDLYQGFLAAMQEELTAIVKLANVQQLVRTKSESYTPLTEETILGMTESALSGLGVHIEGWTQFVEDLKVIQKDAVIIAQWASDCKKNEKTIYITNTQFENVLDADGNIVLDENNQPKKQAVERSQQNGIDIFLTELVDVNSCVLKTKNNQYVIGNIATSDAFSLASEMSGSSVIMKKGILPRFEYRIGENMSVTISSVKVLNMITVTDVTIYTQYKDVTDSQFSNDLIWTDDAYEASGIYNGKKVATAGDTYGLAIDLWVRTNAGTTLEDSGGNIINDASYLILEGELVYEQAQGEDEYGNPVGLLYSYTKDGTDCYFYETDSGDCYENKTSTPVSLPEGTDTYPVYKDAPADYQGVSRIWSEEQEKLLSPALTEYNTSQGAGSCYTFYADSPQEQQAILNLLSHMYVVFTDGGNTRLATAKFDTAENRYYAAGGKVTVPVVLESSQYSYVQKSDSENGEEKEITVQAITMLNRNEATRITALVYLDGENLSNKEALAASKIQGTLNLQFGSSVALNSAGDKELQEQERIVTAAVTTSTGSDTLDYFSDALGAIVTVTVEGDQPNNVTAFFQREINAFQGSRQETMKFTVDSTGKWISEEYTFTAPGTYVLRSVQLDGVDYELQDPPAVTVTGFVVKDVSVYRNGSEFGNSNNTIMTTDNTVTLDLTTEFATEDADKLPEAVRLEFLRAADSATVSVDMYPTTNGWTGSATFSSSGEYKLSYVYLDGELYDLGEDSKTFNLFLGLSAQVDGRPQILPLEDDTEAGTVSVWASILDNNGSPLTELESFSLHYRGESTNKDIEAVMTWNEDSNRYEGKFLIYEPDAYRFYYIQAGDSYITNATQAPVFRARSNKPVSYEGSSNSGGTVFYLPDLDASGNDKNYPGSSPAFLVQLKNSGGAQITATLLNKDTGKTYAVDYSAITATGITDGVTTWKIPVPMDNGSYAGNWVLTKLALGNVMDNYANEYTVANPYVIDLEKIGTPTLKVISNYVVELTGTDETYTFDGYFMDSHSVNGLAVNVYYLDGEEHKALPSTLPVTEVSLIYEHGVGSSFSAGGYTIGSTLMPITVKLPNSADGITFTQQDAATFQVAGTYKLSAVSFKIGNTTVSQKVTGKGDTITVNSAKPVVTVSAVSPGAGTTKRYYTMSNPTSTDQLQTGDFNRIVNDYTVAAYIYTNQKSGILDQEAVHAYAPSVTLQVTGLPSDFSGTNNSAYMVFDNASNGSKTTFTFTLDTSAWKATAAVGAVTDGTESWSGVSTYPVMYPAGNQTVGTLNVVYNDMNISVTLDNPITINQPQYPPSLSFVDAEGYEGKVTLPATQQNIDGGGYFSYTLPAGNTFEVIESVATGEIKPITGEWELVSETYVHTRSGWPWSYKYQSYKTEVKQMKGQSEAMTYTHIYGVVSWKVERTTDGGSTWNTVGTYQAGHALPVDGTYRATPIIGMITPDTNPKVEITEFTKTWTKCWAYDTEKRGDKVDSAPQTVDTTTDWQ